MKSGKKKESFEQIIIKIIICFVIFLLCIMLMVVVHDRYYFHNQVYQTAYNEIGILDKQTKGFPDSCNTNIPEKRVMAQSDSLSAKTVKVNKCRHHSDHLIKSQKVTLSSDVKSSNELNQTVTLCNESDSKKQLIEDFSSIISKLKDVDGIISANGLTYMVSLIVALLIALLTYRIKSMEQLISDYYKLKILNESIYQRSANYNLVLAKIESVFNVAVNIGNVTTILNAIKNDAIATEVGILCSRLSLLCNQIKEQLDDNRQRFGYLTDEEKNILLTYLDDALNGLDGSLRIVERIKNSHLHSILEEIIRRVQNIRDKIDGIEIQDG